MDAQSVKNTDTAGSKGYDAGKKVSGIKRHIAVDTQGLPHAIAVTTAEVTDRKGALQALQRCKPALSRVQALLCDSGYVGRPFAQGVQDILGGHVTVQIAKRSEPFARRSGMGPREPVAAAFARCIGRSGAHEPTDLHTPLQGSNWHNLREVARGGPHRTRTAVAGNHRAVD